MKKLTNLWLLLLVSGYSFSQNKEVHAYRNFPLIVTIQFHSLALPGKNLKSNFSNIGFGLGTEVSYNGRQNWVQQLHAVWYRNKAAGNGIFVYTQTAWRPTLVGHLFSELKAGIGYQYSFRPVTSFKPQNGTWVSVGQKGKGLLALPAGVAVGYTNCNGQTHLAPFIGYQAFIVKGYNKSIPLVPQTLLQVGTRVHL